MLLVIEIVFVSLTFHLDRNLTAACESGRKQRRTRTQTVNDNAKMLYHASKHDSAGCALKLKCCPSTPARKVPRSIYEGARDLARQIAKSREGRTSRRLRKRSRCFCPSQNAFSSWTGSDYEDRMVPAMSSSSQPPSKTSGS